MKLKLKNTVLKKDERDRLIAWLENDLAKRKDHEVTREQIDRKQTNR